MTDAEVKEQLQAAQDLVDSLTEQRNHALNSMAQINAMRRAEQRQVEALKQELLVTTAKAAEFEERLSKVTPAVAPNGVDAGAAPPA